MPLGFLSVRKTRTAYALSQDVCRSRASVLRGKCGEGNKTALGAPCSIRTEQSADNSILIFKDAHHRYAVKCSWSPAPRAIVNGLPEVRLIPVHCHVIDSVRQVSGIVVRLQNVDSI